MQQHLQWGGRFEGGPDPELIAFGSSLEDDLVLARFDLQVSRAHLAVLRAASLVNAADALALEGALDRVEGEIADGTFAAHARKAGAEDVHGAIDVRVRDLAGPAGERLHAGRSRNDQVATALALYVRDRAAAGRLRTLDLARAAIARGRSALEDGTVVAATTHWQPAQPVLLAFWLGAAAENFARAAVRFARVERASHEASPLGAAACSGSSLPLDRDLAARLLGFEAPARNALDAAGDRDLALDLLDAVARALLPCARVSGELVLWCAPAFGYARLGDAASTGSSLMPQKRNPDPFELVRASAHAAAGAYAAAFGANAGVALSYHRDLQEVKAQVVRGTERGLAALGAFARAFEHVRFDGARMTARAGDGYVVATDVAEALVRRGIPARQAHALVGARVALAERGARPLDRNDLDVLATACGLAAFEAPLDPRGAVLAKRTAGSTHPDEVARALDALEAGLEHVAE